MIDRWSQNTSDGIGYIDEEGGKGYHLFVKLNIHMYMYMKIHVSSMLAIGIETLTNTTNKQAATMAYKIHKHSHKRLRKY